MKKKVFWWTVTAFWCLIIFFQSGKDASASDANSLFIVDVINSVLIQVFGKDAGIVSNFMIRKTAHFIEYMILGILLFNCWFTGVNLRRGLTLAFLSGVAYSITDELHQIFVPGRTGKLIDVVIDSAGLVMGLLLITLAVQWKRAHQKVSHCPTEY